MVQWSATQCHKEKQKLNQLYWRRDYPSPLHPYDLSGNYPDIQVASACSRKGYLRGYCTLLEIVFVGRCEVFVCL